MKSPTIHCAFSHYRQLLFDEHILLFSIQCVCRVVFSNMAQCLIILQVFVFLSFSGIESKSENRLSPNMSHTCPKEDGVHR